MSSLIRVLEVDQWTSTGNIGDFSMADFELESVQGGDSEAIRRAFGGFATIKEVDPRQRPMVGHVWFRESLESGKLEQWKANYDSSG